MKNQSRIALFTVQPFLISLIPQWLKKCKNGIDQAEDQRLNKHRQQNRKIKYPHVDFHNKRIILFLIILFQVFPFFFLKK